MRVSAGMHPGRYEIPSLYEQGQLFPTPLAQNAVNQSIQNVHGRYVFDSACKAPSGLAGKLSMGIGGINACVISRLLT